MRADLEQIRDRLQEIAEELADLAIADLSASVRSGAERAPLERRLTRARRAVEKAAALVSEADADPT